MVDFVVQPGGCLQGKFSFPGDKSISHRALLLAALAEGQSTLENFLCAEDTLALRQALHQLGVTTAFSSATKLLVHGVGLHNLQAPQTVLDLGNAGTGFRLLAGVLAAQSFSSTLTGDASLRRRPMQRIAEPLTQMGARVTLCDGVAPMIFEGVSALSGLRYTLPIASAQVKSCLLLAGLFAKGEMHLVEPLPTRDHTERLLQQFGCVIARDESGIILHPPTKLIPQHVVIPGDLSSAAFFIVGATIAANSELLLQSVGMNPTRAGVITILRLMGADITVYPAPETTTGEPVADVLVRSAKLRGIHIPPELVPLAIDEFPAIFIAAACAEGVTFLEGAKELRVKESDRIAVMASALSRLGILVEATDDGILIEGGQFTGGTVQSGGDHRVAMALSMAALCAGDPIVIEDCSAVATSFPTFVDQVMRAGLNIAHLL